MQLRPGLRPEQHWESQRGFPRSSLAGFKELLRGVEYRVNREEGEGQEGREVGG